MTKDEQIKKFRYLLVLLQNGKTKEKIRENTSQFLPVVSLMMRIG